MNAVLDRRVDWSESPVASLKSNDANRLGNESSHRAKTARNPARGSESDSLSHLASVLCEGADGVLSTIFAGALLIVSVSFSMLMIVAMLVVFLCGLACYS